VVIENQPFIFKPGDKIMTNNLPQLKDVYLARRLISSLIRRTPLVLAENLSKTMGYQIYLKLENWQTTGSFKARGAANKLLNLTEAEKKKGVIAFSTGNHGRAVATLSRDLGLKAVICLSERVPLWRQEKMKELGAEVVAFGDSQDRAYEKALEIQKERGLTMIAPFDDPLVISGQGTLGLEIFEELPEVSQVVVPLSGGGLFSGVALAMKSLNPAIKMVGVSMEVAPAMIKSLEKGKPTEIPEKDSLADALLGGIGLDNKYTFALTQKYIDQAVEVSEKEIAAGIFEAFDGLGLMVEGSGAVGLATVLAGKITGSGPVVLVLSGGNIKAEKLMEIFGTFSKQNKEKKI
jgi:threonine dehydratase